MAGTAVSSAAAFPPWARRLKHGDFEKIYRSGQRHFSAHMTVFYLRRQAGPPRVGFTTGRALGKAVERNRIRRRVREAARLELRGLGQPVDVVINPKKSAMNADFEQLRGEIARAFEKIQSSVASGQSPAKEPTRERQ